VASSENSVRVAIRAALTEWTISRFAQQSSKSSLQTLAEGRSHSRPPSISHVGGKKKTNPIPGFVSYFL